MKKNIDNPEVVLSEEDRGFASSIWDVKIFDEKKVVLSDEEMARLIKYSKENQFQLYVGIRLMFIYGLRIGTLLSITEENIGYDVDKNGNILTYFMKIKNRYKYIIDKKDYDNLIKLIKANNKLAKSNINKLNNYNTDAVAERVTYNKLLFKENHYVFLNSQCKRMSAQNWNKTIIKPAFRKLGLPLDYGFKKNGLNDLFYRTRLKFLASKER